jgi:hypothetical protein
LIRDAKYAQASTAVASRRHDETEDHRHDIELAEAGRRA